MDNTKEFFKLSAQYQISPDATVTDMLDDASLLGTLVSDSLAALAMSVDGEQDKGSITDHVGFCQLLYGLSYLAQMGQSASTAAHSLILADRGLKLGTKT